MRLTVGPLPPAVYWRRRAIVLGATLLVLFVIAQACMSSAPAGDRSGSGEADSSASADPGTSDAGSSGSPGPESPTPVPLPDTEPDGEDGPDSGAAGPDGGAGGDPDQCTDDEIRVTAVASRVSFAVGDQVQFTIRIAHDADRSCRRDVGGDLRELYLVRGSGAEQVWSSQHCANPRGSEVIELTEGWEREHHIGFSGQSTSECDGPEAAGPDLAPGEYTLLAGLGTARSEPVTITLT